MKNFSLTFFPPSRNGTSSFSKKKKQKKLDLDASGASSSSSSASSTAAPVPRKLTEIPSEALVSIVMAARKKLTAHWLKFTIPFCLQGLP